MESKYYIPVYYVVGSLMIIFGLYLLYTVNKRRFNRRGPGGLQHFENYRASLLVTLIERVLKIIGFLFILCGLGLLLLAYQLGHEHKALLESAGI